jgi:TPP-dependent pyruvate/acetoin dehydrogenase alpha subunit
VPAVYVIRNNGYAISTPESLQTAASALASRAQGYGVHGVRVDGNDLLAVVSVLREAVDRARGGGGPTLVEALTYRMGAHSTADDPSAYRPAEEPRRWERLDPLARLLQHARWRGLFDEEAEARAWSSSEQTLAERIAECERWPPPPLESLFEDVTHERTPQLEEQRRRFKRYQFARRRARSDIP